MPTEEQEPWHKNEPCILGIDEAGRGPVLGPMVYTAAYCAKSSTVVLNALGADDSKQLSEEQRDNLRKKIDGAPFLRTSTCVLTADELSKKMLRKEKYNLNLISHDTALNLVENALNEGVNVTEIYVDTVGDPARYAEKFRNRFPQIPKVVVAKKADSTYRIVGAASIVAKTTRDRHIREWIFPEEERSAAFGPDDANRTIQFAGVRGSGYPSDPATKKWMEQSWDEIFGFPTFVRFSWGTTRTILQKRTIDVDWCVFWHRSWSNFEAVMLLLFSNVFHCIVLYGTVLLFGQTCRESDEEEDEKGQDQKVKTKDIKSFFAVKPKGSESASKRRKLSSAKPLPVPKILASMSLRRIKTLL